MAYTAPPMGVTAPDVSFLLAARQLGVSYESTLTIGRQWLLANPASLVSAYETVGQPLDQASAKRLVQEDGIFAEPVFRQLGARQVDSLDASDYEGATNVHDLNTPLPAELHGRYSLVFDGGSLEHVFNLPMALKSCMQAVAPGGHFIAITPADSLSGHGFYQFSPELFYRALSPENGFEVNVLLMRPGHRWARWRAVTDPTTVGARVTSSSPFPTMMFVLAKRISEVEPFGAWPQQGDYASEWGGGTSPRPGKPGNSIIKRLPAPVHFAIGAAGMFGRIFGRWSGPNHFRQVRIADVANGSLGGA
jgi:hypothetical protein